MPWELQTMLTVLTQTSRFELVDGASREFSWTTWR